MVELKVIGRIRPMRLPGIVPVAPRNVSSSGIGNSPGSSPSKLQLGGNAPFIVFDDADLHEAAKALVSAKLRNSGQVVASRRTACMFRRTCMTRSFNA